MWLVFCIALALAVPYHTPGRARAAQRPIKVSSSAELKSALKNAKPGDIIQLADGVYKGEFEATVSGTPDNRIVLSGSSNAVLNAGSVAGGFGFYLRGSFWTLTGFTITNVSKGIVAEHATNNTFDHLTIFNIGEEAVHFRAFSSSNVVQHCVIRDTGVTSPGNGEGVYIGSAVSNWPDFSGGAPDKSDFNRILSNTFGPNVRSEAIDAKEGTTGGQIISNLFDGRGMSGQNFADSWVDVKGNRYIIANNSGMLSVRHGFETHEEVPGGGDDNVFSGNIANVQASGFGFNIERERSRGNIVYDNNKVIGARSGFASIRVTRTPPCPAIPTTATAMHAPAGGGALPADSQRIWLPMVARAC